MGCFFLLRQNLNRLAKNNLGGTAKFITIASPSNRRGCYRITAINLHRTNDGGKPRQGFKSNRNSVTGKHASFIKPGTKPAI